MSDDQSRMTFPGIVARLRAVDHMSVEDCFLQSHLFAAAADEIDRLRRGWLRVIQQENSCPATGGGCLAKRCGCVEEMEMLANEQV
jgi:hypothetical protein